MPLPAFTEPSMYFFRKLSLSGTWWGTWLCIASLSLRSWQSLAWSWQEPCILRMPSNEEALKLCCPLCSADWFFGREGEVFQYKYRGSHVVQSGYSSAVPAEVLRGVERGESVAGEGVLLFKGRVVDCESAGVYTLGGGGDGEFEGVMLSSEYESAD